MRFKISENYAKESIVGFVPNKNLPVYRWFYYKEGFSRDFVEYAFDRLNIKRNEVILDPFVGVGTTLVYSKEKGNKAYGLDVNEVALLASKVKTRDYDIEKIKLYIKDLKPRPYEETISLGIIKKAFPKKVLEEILAYKNSINNSISEEKYREFFILALMRTSTITTYAEKDGGSIKINKKRRFPPVRKVFKKIVKEMITDIKKINFRTSENSIIIKKGDTRMLSKYIDDANVIITSPPYLNKIEYTNVYAIEQYLFISKKISKPAVRSYIGENIEEKEDVFEGKYPMNNISRAYFKDMWLFIKELSRLPSLNRGAIVIGNGCFPNGVVESDILLGELLEKVGFKVEEIERVKVRWCMRNRVVKVAPMHESIIWFRR